MNCLWCEEPIVGPDAISVTCISGDGIHLRQHHVACSIRSVVGSVGHLNGRCSCHGGDEEDPPGMTRRQAAEAAATLWKATHGH